MLGDGKVVLLFKLDLSAAFDTVDHSILLNLLKCKFKIKGTVLKWLTSYLSGRSFSVKIGYVNGRKVLLIYGVPQGSILGPLLFIIYVSDLPEVASSSDISLQSYADDSHLFSGFDPLNNYAETMDKMKECLFEIEKWMKSKYLKINVDKTEVLFIATPRHHANFSNMSISIGKKCYVSSSNACMKSLGVHFESTLSIRRMVSETVKTCNHNLKRLSTLRYILSVKHKLLLVKSFILCKVDFCSVLLAGAPDYQIKRLQVLINKSIRFIYLLKKRVDNFSWYQKEAHVLPMKFRIMYKCCLFVYKILHNNCPHYFENVLQPKHPSEFNFRSDIDNLLFVQTTNRNTLQFHMIKHWNDLPYNLRSQTSTESFKTQLKTYYFNIAYN